MVYAAGSAGVVVDLGAGTASGFASVANIASVQGGNGADVLTGNDQANTLNGGGGNDFFVARADDASDLYTGAAGFDTLDLSAYSGDLSVDISFATATILGTGTTAALSDRVQSVEALILGGGADIAFGSAGANHLWGGDGDDTLSGVNGNDTLEGDAGNDMLIGGAGLDMLVGGLGDDVFVFATPAHSTLAASDVIMDFGQAGSAGGDVIDIGDMAGLAFQFVGSGASHPAGPIRCASSTTGRTRSFRLTRTPTSQPKRRSASLASTNWRHRTSSCDG